MFSAQSSAQAHDLLEQFADGGRQHALPLLQAQVISQNVDMEVAVSRMAIAHSSETVFDPHRFHLPQKGRQLPSRDYCVFFFVDTFCLDRLSHPAAKKPQLFFFRGRLGKEHFPAPVGLQHRQDALALRHQILGRKTVHLHNQMCCILWGQHRFRDAGIGLGQDNGVALHEFQGAGHRP